MLNMPSAPSGVSLLPIRRFLVCRPALVPDEVRGALLPKPYARRLVSPRPGCSLRSRSHSLGAMHGE
jgi:hypothetical protein